MKLRMLYNQLLKWLWYNALIMPVIAAFYVPYNIFWLQLNSLQLLKWFLTAGAASSVVNIVLRPWNAWIAKFLDKRFSKKTVVVEAPDEEGVFAVHEVEAEKK